MEYNANSIQQLTFREGVRKRVGIYLGSADHTGVIAGLLELVNNATDEALVCSTATKIELEIGSSSPRPISITQLHTLLHFHL